jgi:FkbM family methyltransferase
MQGILFDDIAVNIDAASLEMGGSWLTNGCAWGGHALKEFYSYAQHLASLTVFDVGANTGSFALLSAFHPGMTVYAFEPSPLARAILKKNVALNGLENRVHIMDVALSDSPGQGAISVPARKELSGLTMLDGQPVQECHVLTVEVSTVDCVQIDYGLQRVDMLKVDVEGKELSVLRGGAKTIERDRPYIMAEYPTQQRCKRPIDIALWLRARGYETQTIHGEIVAW